MIIDAVSEYIVQKKIEPSDKARTMLLCLLLAAPIPFLIYVIFIYPILFAVSICAIAVLIWLMVRTSRRVNVEYEYSFVNGELTVDKITNMSSRKHLTSFDVCEVEKAGRYNPETFRATFPYGQIFAASTTSDNAVFLQYRQKSTGRVGCVVIERNEQFINSMKRFFNPTVFREGLAK